MNVQDWILDNLTSGFILIDTNGKILIFNEYASEILKIKKQNAVGKNIKKIKILKDISDIMFNTLNKNTPYVREEIYIRSKKINIPVGITTSLVKEQREIIGISANFRDLSEINLLKEQVRRKDRLSILGRMAAMLAHEIRNPVTSISALSELIERKIKTKKYDKIKTYNKKVIIETERIEKLIQDILTFSKYYKPDYKKANLHFILNEALKTIKTRLTKKKFKLIKKIKGQKYYGEFDVIQIRQVIDNIINNAVESMHNAGSLTVELNKDKKYLILSVTDQGAGIKKEDIEKIYIPFYTTKGFQGTGLGLTVCEQIISVHNGDLEIKSKYGEGTQVIIKIPRKKS